MDEFLKELMDLITVEANNGDYYLEGYVPGYKLDALINKYFPEFEFTSNNTYQHWFPRVESNPRFQLIADVYNSVIAEQLASDTRILKLFKKDN